MDARIAPFEGEDVEIYRNSELHEKMPDIIESFLSHK